MASIRRRNYRRPDGTRRKSLKWYVRYKDAGGVYREIPGFRDKEATKQLASKLEREAALGQVGVCDPFVKHRQIPLSDHLKDFERSQKGAGHSAKYIDNTCRHIVRLMNDLNFHYLDDVSSSRVQEFVGRIVESGRSPATANNYLAASQTFFNWAVRDGRMPVNPLLRLAKRNIEVDRRRKRRSLTVDELSRLVVVAERGPRVEGTDGTTRAVVYVLAGYLGLRKSEIGGLLPSDFDFDGGIVTVRAAVSKNKKQAQLPLHPVVIDRVRRYLNSMGPVQASDPIFQIAWRNTAAMVRYDLQAAGLEFKTSSGRVDFHALRVSFASNLGRFGVPIQMARELMRHSTIELTAKVYTKLEVNDLDQSIRRLPDLASGYEPRSQISQTPKVTCDEPSSFGSLSETEKLPILLPTSDDPSRLSMAKHDDDNEDLDSSQRITMSGVGSNRRGDGDSRQGVGKSAPSRSRTYEDVVVSESDKRDASHNSEIAHAIAHRLPNSECFGGVQSDSELRVIAESWRTLPRPIRNAIIAIVQTSRLEDSPSRCSIT